MRVTAGLLSNDVKRAIVGADIGVSENTTILVDWTTGRDAFATIGVSQALGSSCTGLLYYARNNSSGGEDFVGLNLCWAGSWR